MYVFFEREKSIDLLFHLFKHSLVVSCMCSAGDDQSHIFFFKREGKGRECGGWGGGGEERNIG